MIWPMIFHDHVCFFLIVCDASPVAFGSSFGSCWGGVHQFLFAPMDNVLRSLEDLSRTELVWLNTYLAGRLRALPPENEQQPHPLPKAMPSVSVTMPGTTCSDGLPDATVAPLSERIDALNYSLDPWERTDAAPQG